MHTTTHKTTQLTTTIKSNLIVSAYYILYLQFATKIRVHCTSSLYSYDANNPFVWRYSLQHHTNMTITTMTRNQLNRLIENIGINGVIDNHTHTSYHYTTPLLFDTFGHFDAVDLSVKAYRTYLYGLQGQEKDDEIKGEGNSINFTYRMHDPRLGRFFAVDPLSDKYPHYSPYMFSGNKVIAFIELEGLEEVHYILNQVDNVTYNVSIVNKQFNPGNVTHYARNTVNNVGQVQLQPISSIQTVSNRASTINGVTPKVNSILASFNPGEMAKLNPAIVTPGTASGNNVPNQFNFVFVVVRPPVPAGAPINQPDFTNAVANLMGGIGAVPLGLANPIVPGNVGRILVITDGSVAGTNNALQIIGTPAIPASGGNPAVPATGLMALYPGVQFATATDPSVQPNTVDLVVNPTQDFISNPGPTNPVNIFRYNPTMTSAWNNGRNEGGVNPIQPPATAPILPPTELYPAQGNEVKKL